MKKVIAFSYALLLSSTLFAYDKAIEKQKTDEGHSKTTVKWVVPDESKIPNNEYGNAIRYGKKLLLETYNIIGPNVKDEKMRFTGNNYSCSSCHAEAGTVKYQAGFVGIHARFPQYQARADGVATIQNRINGCMLRSMNGKPLPDNSKEMKAIVTYMKWLSVGVPVGANVEGQGLAKVNLLDRAADPKKGEKIYADKCAACHGVNGEGIKNDVATGGYMFPALWGDDSYNTGAGMYRLIKAAQYIKGNMPKGAATLTDAEAFDVASFMNMPTHTRPVFKNREADFPDRRVKPVDVDVLPHDDAFGVEEHRFGPYNKMYK
jgi:thiosulfate dehydrogenase